MKKIYTILNLCTAFLLIGCGVKGGSENMDNPLTSGEENPTWEVSVAGRDIVPYDVLYEEIDAREIYAFSLLDDSLMLVSYGEDTRTLTEYGTYPASAQIYTFDLEGRLIQQNEVDHLLSPQTDIDPEGNVWSLLTFFASDEATGEYNSTNSTIYCYDSAGELLSTLDLGPLEFSTQEYGAQFMVGEDGNFYFLSDTDDYLEGINDGNIVYVFGSDGSQLLELHTTGDRQVKRLTRLPGGRVAAILGDGSKASTLREIDLEAGGFTEEWDLELSGKYVYICRAMDSSYDLLLSSETGVYGYSLEEEKSTQLISWANRRINNQSYEMFQYVALFSGQYVYSLLRDNDAELFDNTTFRLIRLEPADEEKDFGQSGINTNADKRTVNLSALKLNDEMKEAVVLFNRQNEKYYLEVREYLNPGITEEDALSSLLADIFSGNVPDILMLDDTIEYESLASKGFFADLYGFMTKDETVNPKDYIPNILTALETEGKLYTGVTSFGISTLMGKVSDVGEEMGWTWDEYKRLMDSKPVGTLPMDDFMIRMSKYEFIKYMLMSKLDTYVDFASGECSFENVEFEEFLKMADSYPEKPGRRVPTVSFREGDTLLMNASIASFGIGKSMETAYFGEPTTFIGFPTEDGMIGSIAYGKNRFAIMEQAKEQEGAWEFARYLLTDFQEAAGASGFPVRSRELDLLAMEAMQDPEGDGNRDFLVTDGNFTYTIEVENNTVLDNQKVYALIQGTTTFSSHKKQIIGIVLEEANYYFAGDKTVGEVAAVIQNRVSLYLDEAR